MMWTHSKDVMLVSGKVQTRNVNMGVCLCIPFKVAMCILQATCKYHPWSVFIIGTARTHIAGFISENLTRGQTVHSRKLGR